MGGGDRVDKFLLVCCWIIDEHFQAFHHRLINYVIDHITYQCGEAAYVAAARFRSVFRACSGQTQH